MPLFYSWPSKGNANDYSHDTNNADQSVAYLKTFLGDLAARGVFEFITLVAHSMGNRALTREFVELASDLPNEQLALFNEFIPAAPDIDADVFRTDIAPALAAAGSPVTLYASAKDLAMVASRHLGGAPRAGDTRQGVVVVKGVETIDATKADAAFGDSGMVMLPTTRRSCMTSTISSCRGSEPHSVAIWNRWPLTGAFTGASNDDLAGPAIIRQLVGARRKRATDRVEAGRQMPLASRIPHP